MEEEGTSWVGESLDRVPGNSETESSPVFWR